jgi:hypothetical protein
MALFTASRAMRYRCVSDRGVKPEHRTSTLEGAGDPEQRLDIRGKGLERCSQTELRQAHWAEPPGQVVGVTDDLVQQSGDFGGVGSCRGV